MNTYRVTVILPSGRVAKQVEAESAREATKDVLEKICENNGAGAFGVTRLAWISAFKVEEAR